MAPRPDYACYPPVGRALYTVTFLGGDVYGVSRYVFTNNAPPGAPCPQLYRSVTLEPTGIRVTGNEAAIDAMWELAAAEGNAVANAPLPPHRRPRARRRQW